MTKYFLMNSRRLQWNRLPHHTHKNKYERNEKENEEWKKLVRNPWSFNIFVLHCDLIRVFICTLFTIGLSNVILLLLLLFLFSPYAYALLIPIKINNREENEMSPILFTCRSRFCQDFNLLQLEITFQLIKHWFVNMTNC